jgi:hypothetical protein
MRPSMRSKVHASLIEVSFGLHADVFRPSNMQKLLWSQTRKRSGTSWVCGDPAC